MLHVALEEMPRVPSRDTKRLIENHRGKQGCIHENAEPSRVQEMWELPSLLCLLHPEMQKVSQFTPIETAAQNCRPKGMEEGGRIFLSTSEDNLQIEGAISPLCTS